MSAHSKILLMETCLNSNFENRIAVISLQSGKKSGSCSREPAIRFRKVDFTRFLDYIQSPNKTYLII